MVLNERLEALAFIPDDPGKYSASLRHGVQSRSSMGQWLGDRSDSLSLQNPIKPSFACYLALAMLA